MRVIIRCLLQHETLVSIEKHNVILFSRHSFFSSTVSKHSAPCLSQETSLWNDHESCSLFIPLSSSCLSPSEENSWSRFPHLVIWSFSRVRTFSNQLRSVSEWLPPPLHHRGLISFFAREGVNGSPIAESWSPVCPVGWLAPLTLPHIVNSS